MSAIEARVAEYNARINSLRETNDQLTETNNGMMTLEGAAVMSKNSKAKMNETLAKVDPAKLAEAKTLEDSVNLAIGHNIRENITEQGGDEDDVQIDIDKTVVMISISDKLLFNTGSYRINSKADPLLKKTCRGDQCRTKSTSDDRRPYRFKNHLHSCFGRQLGFVSEESYLHRESPSIEISGST